MSTSKRLSIAAVVGALLLSGCHGGSRADGTPTAPGSTTASAAPSPVLAATSPPTRRIGGTFFYYDPGKDRYVAYRNGRFTTILKGADSYYTRPKISPDGTRIAWVAMKDRRVWLAGTDGTGARRLTFVANELTSGLGWTADGGGLLVAKDDKPSRHLVYGVLRIADGRFTALPTSIQRGVNYRATADGKRYQFIGDRGTIVSATIDGSGVTRTPVIGDRNSAVNPRQLNATAVVSADATGARVTASVLTGFDKESPSSAMADMIIDTATGKVLPVPVQGEIQQLLLNDDGTLLVRSGTGAQTTLTLLSADLTVLDRTKEPAATRGLGLIAHHG